MRISDWSSDVCSSDLLRAAADGQGGGTVAVYFIESIFAAIIKFGRLLSGDIERFSRLRFRYPAPAHAERSEERRVGKECVIRVDLGGRRIIKIKNYLQNHTEHHRAINKKTTIN